MEVDSDFDDIDIPDFAKVWHPSVRRPITPPHPTTYHECINPRAIFELLESPSSEYILVVPRSCAFCVYRKVACSRLLPCTRCDKTARPCQVSRAGYQKLPPSKKAKGASITNSTPQNTSVSRTRFPKAAALRSSQAITTPDPEPLAKKPITTSPGFLDPPGGPLEPSGDMEKVDFSPPPQNAPPRDEIASSTNISTTASAAPIWMPVKPGKAQCTNDTSASASTPPIVDTPPRTPRVWANSRTEIAAIFPELTKSVTGISCPKFDVPTLFLEHPNCGDIWRDANTLEIARDWNYNCCREALEGGNAHDDSRAARVEYGSVDHLQVDPLPFTPQPVVSEALPCSGIPVPRLSAVPSPSLPSPPVFPPWRALQPHTPVASPSATPTTQLSTVPSPSLPSPPVLPPWRALQPHTPVASPSVTPTTRLPVQKPPEIEALVQCREYNIPLLVFVSQKSGLLPQRLPVEYACVCLGFFFISDIKAKRVGITTNTPTHVLGRARWRITLEWAPGGEEGLLEDTDVKLHPWWIDPVDCAVENDIGSVKIPYRPRDLGQQYFSFLPLDLLADFKPSEFFPRGWYCRGCGMLNVQLFFRHQICRSSRCKRNLERGKATSDESPLIGHVDSLQALRDPQHVSLIHDPLDIVPSAVDKVVDSWDDGMWTLSYEVNNGARVKHIFTGNHEDLQEDATRLLLAVQKDVVLSRRDLHSPYFTWSTIPDPEQTYTGDAQGKPEIPAPIFDIQYVLLRYTQGYGDIDDTSINHILIQAWVTAGSKRGTLFKATSHVITILCLGAEVVMKLVPKRGFGEISIKSAEDPMKVDSERILGEAGALSQLETASHAVGEASGSSTSLTSGVAGSKSKTGKMGGKLPSELSLTLVHGDAVILEGDDFECQIKRSGTTILLIGSGEAV